MSQRNYSSLVLGNSDGRTLKADLSWNSTWKKFCQL